MTTKYEPTEQELAFANASYIPKKPPKVKQESKYAPTAEELSFAQQSAQPQYESSESGISGFTSKLNALTKGLVQGAKEFGESIGTMIQPGSFESADKEIGSVFGIDIDKGLKEVKEKGKFKPSTPEEQAQLQTDLEERFPSEPGFIEDVLEKTGKIAPSALIGPGGIVQKGLSSVGSAVVGAGIKKLGGGEGAQTIGEILTLTAPNLHRALVGRNAQQQRLIDFGRSRGMTEEQLVPAIQEMTPWRRFLSRFASKGQGTQDRLEASRQAVGDIFEDFRNSPGAQQTIPRNRVADIMREYAHEYQDLPVQLRNQIAPELRVLVQSPGRGEDLIRFYNHVNYGTTDPHRIGRFQEVTRRAIEAIEPQLGEEFRLANRLAHNRYATAHALRPPHGGVTMQQVKAFGALYGLVSGDYTLLKSALGFLGASKAAQVLLLNPRFQNLSTKFAQAINNNSPVLAQKLLNEMARLSKDDAPEFYDEIKDVDVNAMIPKSKHTKQQPKTK